ncbi:hypothetical protein D3C80_1885840 [compost metagenome]
MSCTEESVFVSAESDMDSLNVDFHSEPDWLYFEVDQAESFLSGVYLDRDQVESLRDQLSAWLAERES